MKLKEEKLFHSSFVYVCIAHFCLFFAFYLILPVMPLYLIDEFQTGKSLAGLILSSYTLAALLVRPFSGFIVDSFARKPVYLLTYFIFIGYFSGYIFATSLLFFTIIRATHGLPFGIVSTASSTIAIDVMPASRRGEGIGYFGVMGTIAMATGPMTGLFIMETFSYQAVFLSSVIIGAVGFIFANLVKTEKRELIEQKIKLSFDRFVLLKGMPAFPTVLLLAFMYGILITYLILFAREININTGGGLFLTLMSFGLILSRLTAGKVIDKGYLTKMIIGGKLLLLVTISILILTENIYTFYIIAIFIGVAFGFIAPAYQTLFINLAEHNQRGTANSTYLTAWDMGLGAGVLIGGQIAEVSSYHSAYAFGLLCILASTLIFMKFTASYYNKNKLR